MKNLFINLNSSQDKIALFQIMDLLTQKVKAIATWAIMAMS